MKRSTICMLLAASFVSANVSVAAEGTAAPRGFWNSIKSRLSPKKPAAVATRGAPAVPSPPTRRTDIVPASGIRTASQAVPPAPAVPPAEENPAKPVDIAPVLTLEQLESLALKHNPTLSQASAAVDQQVGLYRQAGLYPNPQLGYENSSATRSGQRQSNGAFFSQEFVTARKLDLAQQAQGWEIQKARWDYEAQRQRVVNDVRIRYYEALAADLALKITGRLVENADELHGTVKRLLEAKQAARTDLLQAKMQLEAARAQLDEATHRHEAAWQQLAAMLGLTDLQPQPIAGSLTDHLPPLDLETCWRDLLSGSPQLRSSEAGVNHGWAELRSAQAQVYPNFTLQTVAERDSVANQSTISTLVALPVPFFNRNQGNIEKAVADVRVNQMEIERVQLVLRDQLAELFRRYKSSLKQANRLETAILPHAEENLKLTKEGYPDIVPLAQVLEAQKAYFEAEMARIEALAELRKVTVEITGLQLTGGLNPSAIGSAIQAQPIGGMQRQRALLKDVQDRAQKQLLPAAQIGR